MEPFYLLLICLPAALVWIACGCGVAVLWPPAAGLTDHACVGRKRNRRNAV